VARLVVLTAFAGTLIAIGLVAYSSGIVAPSAQSAPGVAGVGEGLSVASLAWPGRALGLAATSGGVVWEQHSRAASVNGLWLFDATRGSVRRLLSTTAMVRPGAVLTACGSTVIWSGRERGSGRPDGRVCGFDLLTQRRFTAARHGAAPAAGKNIVVWVVGAGGHGTPGSTVAGLDLVSDARFTLDTGCEVRQVAATGHWIAWLGCGADAGTLCALDRRTGRTYMVARHGTALALDENRLVWASPERGGRTAIGLWDTSRRRSQRLLTVRGDVGHLVMSHDLLAWEQTSNAGDVWAYDLPSRQAFPVCATAAAQTDPVVVGRTVYWADRRSGHWELYRSAVARTAVL
jgi:hypothetical protein